MCVCFVTHKNLFQYYHDQLYYSLLFLVMIVSHIKTNLHSTVAIIVKVSKEGSNCHHQ